MGLITAEKNKSLSLGYLLDLHLEKIDGAGSSRAWANKVVIAQTIRREIGDREVNIAPEEIAAYINSYTKKRYFRGGHWHRYSQTHINKVLDLLNCAFRDAVRAKIVECNPMYGLKKPIS